MTGITLSEDLVSFLTHGSLVRVAAASATRVPDLTFALACFIDAARQRVRVALDSVQAGSVLALIASSGRAAVVCTDPVTYRTVQLKANDVRIAPVPDTDLAEIVRRVGLGNQRLALIGFADPFASTLNAYRAEDLVFLHFGVAELYDQTPGPNAGKAMPGEP